MVLARIIAAGLGLLYVVSAWEFIIGGTVSFISYTATEPLPQWVVANLGARLLAIGAGMIAAAALGRRGLLLIMLGVRIAADLTGTLISTTTAGVPGFVVPVLAGFVALEAVAIGLAARAKAYKGGKNETAP